MPQHVLLGAHPPEILQAVRDGLEASGYHVQTAEDVESVVGIARSRTVDLVIVAEQLSGGTGSDACMVLERLPGHAPLLYVGDTLVPGADAVAAANDPGAILEQAMLLLDGEALIDSLGDVQSEAAAEEKDDEEDVPVTRKSPARQAVEEEQEDDEDVADTQVSPAVPPADPAPPPTAAPPAPPASAKSAGNGAQKKEVPRASLETMLRAVREADYFEILGVSVEATVEDVKAAHAALRASLSAMGAVPRLQLDEVQTALDEARDVLSEPALRAAYTRNRL